MAAISKAPLNRYSIFFSSSFAGRDQDRFPNFHQLHTMSLKRGLLMALLGVMALSMGNSIEIPCPEFHPRLNYPCQCGLNDINATRINCDGSVFVEFPLLPYRFYIQEFSQRHAGIQTLGAQLFTASDLPLVRVDFSYNQIRRLTERLFDGVEDTIEVIQLGHNLLGDNLNPVFSSGEFQNLEFLRVLDLSYNQLTEIEEGLLEGCTNLKVRWVHYAGIRSVHEMQEETCLVS